MNAEDTATLQVLKTMDSISFKTQQLQTSLQSLYVESGLEELYKGILDIGNNILITFNEITKIGNLPIPAIAGFIQGFTTISTTITALFKVMLSRISLMTDAYREKEQIARQIALLEERKALIQEASYREKFTKDELAEQEKAIENELKQYRLMQQMKTDAARDGALQRRNIANGESTGNIPGLMSSSTKNFGIMMGLNIGGLILSGISATLTKDNMASRIGASLAGIVGSALQGAGFGMMLGHPLIGAILGGVLGVIQNIGIFVQTMEEQVKEAEEAAEEANNKAILSKDTANTLEEQIEKYEKLKKAQYDSAEALEEYQELSNSIAENHPELVQAYDNEGNAIIDLTRAYAELGKYRGQSIEDAAEAAKKSYSAAIKAKEEADSLRPGLAQDAAIKPLKLEKESSSQTRDRITAITDPLYYKITEDFLDTSGNFPDTSGDFFDASFDFSDLSNLFYNVIYGNRIPEDDMLKFIGDENGVVDEKVEDLKNILKNTYTAEEKVTLGINDNLIDQLVDSLVIYYVNLFESERKDAEIVKNNAEAGIANFINEQRVNKKAPNYSGWADELDRASEIRISYVQDIWSKKEDQSDKAFKNFIDNEAPRLVEEVDLAINEFWSGLSDYKREQVNDLINNVDNYSQKDFTSRLTNIVGQNYAKQHEEGINAIQNGLIDDTINSYDTFMSAINERKEDSKYRLDLPESIDDIDINTILQNFSNNAFDALLNVYDYINDLVQNNSISVGTGQNIISEYIKLLNSASNLTNQEDRNAALNLIQNWDDFSLTGIQDLRTSLQGLNLTEGLDGLLLILNDLAGIIPVNLVTETQSFITRITSGMEDFEKAISNAGKGMDWKTATELANKLGTTLNDENFRLENGKYYYDDLSKINEAYLKDNDAYIKNLIDSKNAEQEAYKKFSKLMPFSNPMGLYYNQEVSLDDLENWFAVTDLTSFNIGLSEDQVLIAYEEYLSSIGKTEGNIADFYIWQAAQIENTYDSTIGESEKYTKQIMASAALSAGNIDEFLNQIFGIPETAFDNKIFNSYKDLITSGSMFDIAQDANLAPWVEQIQKYREDVISKTYETIFSGLEDPQNFAIKADDSNSELLENLTDILIKAGNNVYVFSNDFLSESLATQINTINDALSKESALNKSTKIKYANDTIKALTESVSDTLDSLNNIFNDINDIDIEDLNNILYSGLDLDLQFAIDDFGRVSLQTNIDDIQTNLWNLYKNGNLYLKDYNDILAKAEKSVYESSDIGIITEVLENRDKLTEENIASLANVLKLSYEQAEQFIIEYSDGTKHLNVPLLKNYLNENNEQLGEAISYQINQVISESVDNFSNLIKNLSSGFTSYIDMQTALEKMNQFLNEEDKLDFNDVFNYDEITGAYQLTVTGLATQIKSLINQLPSLTEEEAGIVRDLIQSQITELARSIDVVSFIEAENRSEGSQAYEQLEKSLNDYISVIKELGGSAILNGFLSFNASGKNIIDFLLQGGQQAVQVAQELAKAAGQELSASDIESIYRGEVSKLTNAYEQLTYGPGAIIDSTAQTILHKAGYATQQLGETGQYVIQSVGNLTEAYRIYLKQLKASGEATLSDINAAAAQVLANSDGEQDVIDALGDAAGMTYERFGEILTKNGIELTEELIKNLESASIVQGMGGNKMRIIDFQAFADLMNWDAGSEEYVSAFKTYNDSMIELNRQTERNIVEEVQALESAGAGDQINLTQLSSVLSNEVNSWYEGGGIYNSQLKALTATLEEYGAQLKDGILTLDRDANLPAIIQTIADYGSRYGGLLREDMAALADTLDNVFNNFIEAVSNGLSGKLSNTDAFGLQELTKNLGIDVELQFLRTSEGLKLAKNSAVELYLELQKISDSRAGQMFEIIADSLTSDVDAGLDNMSNLMSTISETQDRLQELTDDYKALEAEISAGNITHHEEERLKILGDQKAQLEKQLELYQKIARHQMDNPDSYNFMDRKLPDALQGPVNFWDSLGKANKILNKSASSGYMDFENFYNILNEIVNLSVATQGLDAAGEALVGAGEHFNSSVELMTYLLEQSSVALTNVDGEGLKVDMSKIGQNFLGGAQGMKKNLDKGIKEFADSQIEMLDAEIMFLEAVVAMEELGDIEVDGIEGFTIGDIFNDGGEENDGDFTGDYSKKAEIIKNRADNNDELGKALKGVIINGHSLYEMLETATYTGDELKEAWSNLGMTEEQYYEVMSAVIKAVQSGDYTLDSLGESVQSVIEKLFPDGITFSIGDKEITIAGGTTYVIDWESDTTQDILDKIKEENPDLDDKELQQKLRDAFTHYPQGTQTIEELEWVLEIQGKITLTAENTWATTDGKEFDTQEEAARHAELLSAIGNGTPEGESETFITETGGVGERTTVKCGSKDVLVMVDENGKRTYKGVDSGLEGDTLEDLVQKEIEQDLTTKGINPNSKEGRELAQNKRIDYGLPVEITPTVSIKTPDGSGQLSEGIMEAVEEWLGGGENPPEDNIIQKAIKTAEQNIENGTYTLTLPDGSKITVKADDDTQLKSALEEKFKELLDPLGIGTAIKTAFENEEIISAIGEAMKKGIESALVSDENSEGVPIDEITLKPSSIKINAEDIQATISAGEETQDISVDSISLKPTTLSVDISEASATLAETDEQTTNIPISNANSDIADLTIDNITKSHYDSTLTLSDDIENGEANITNLSVGATNMTPNANLAALQTMDFSATSQSLNGVTSNVRNIAGTSFNNFSVLSALLDTIQSQVQAIWDIIQNFAGKTFTVELNQTGSSGGSTSNTNNNGSGGSGGKTTSTPTIDTSSFTSAAGVVNTTLSNTGTAMEGVPDISDTFSNTADSMGDVPDKTGLFKSMAVALGNIPDVAYRIKRVVTELGNIPESKNISITATVAVSATGGATVTGQFPSKGSKITVAASKGNIALAGGKNTLMGELGPELVVSNGHYHVVGQNGPEMVNLADDAIVFNHQQTEDLLKHGNTKKHGKPVTNEKNAISLATGNIEGPAMATASQALAQLKQLRALWEALSKASAKDLGSLAGSGGGGGSGGGDNKEPVNVTEDIERWYNLLRQIEKVEQQISYQETLQSKIESDRVANGYALYESYQKELDLLDSQVKRHKELANLQKSWYDRKREDLENSSYGLIFTYDDEGLMQYVDGEGHGLDILENLTARDINGKPTGHAKTAQSQLEYLASLGFNLEDLLVNDDGTKAAKSVKVGKKGKVTVTAKNGEDANDAMAQMMQNFWDNVDGKMDELDGIYDSYNEELEASLEAQEKQNEILQKLVDNQISIEEDLVNAIEAREQAEIDRLTDEKDALQESMDKFIDGLNEQLSREQDMYKNDQSNQELNKLQRQLAILQRSGGSASQIRDLQSQIDSKQQDMYFQKQQEQIDAVKEASDKQIERLETQIDLMTETLEYQKENGLLWQEVREIMQMQPEEAINLLQQWDPDYRSKSELQIAEDIRDFTKRFQLWVGERDDSENKETFDADGFYEKQAQRFKDNGLEITDDLKLKALQAWDTKYKETGSRDEADAAANAVYDEAFDKAMAEKNKPVSEPEPEKQPEKPTTQQTQTSNDNAKGTVTVASGAKMNIRQKANASSKSLGTVGAGTYKWTKQSGVWVYIPKFGGWINGAYKNYTSTKKYDTGGYTGSWGTSGKLAILHEKELVLNKDDTKNMLEAIKQLREYYNAFKSSQMETWRNELDSMFAQAAMINTPTYSSEGSGDTIIIEEANVNMEIKRMNNDYDARRAGEAALDEMVKIARKTNTLGVARR